MIAPRRFFPSISSLLALEAVERLGTASAAAEELCLTHSAVSRQLKTLEEQLGVNLFIRKGQGLTLTSAGKEYTDSIRDALQNIARSSLKIKANDDQSSLTLAILPSFGLYWLHSLKDFSKAHPEIIINMNSRLSPFDFNTDHFDAAIHYGQKNWQGVHYLEISKEKVLPVCSPTLALSCKKIPDDLLNIPLLHLESRPGAWEEWFNLLGHKVDNLRGMLFDQYTMICEAAILGYGAALLPEYLALPEIEKNRLVPLYDKSIEVPGRYYLVWSKGIEPSIALQTFIEWIKSNSEQTK